MRSLLKVMYPKICNMRILTLTGLLVLAAVQVLVLQTKNGRGETSKLHTSATFQMHPRPRKVLVVNRKQTNAHTYECTVSTYVSHNMQHMYGAL